MANVKGIITEDVANRIALGLTVYDTESKKLGTVEDIDRERGWFIVGAGPLRNERFYLPFSLVASVDPRELFVALPKDALERDYASPPARSTAVEAVGGERSAVTTEPSGYDGAPLVVDRVKLDELRSQIAAGDHVYAAGMAHLGVIKRYDEATGWMLVDRGHVPRQRDLFLPITVVQGVNPNVGEVYLEVSPADIERLQRLEPVDVVMAPAEMRDRA